MGVLGLIGKIELFNHGFKDESLSWIGLALAAILLKEVSGTGLIASRQSGSLSLIAISALYFFRIFFMFAMCGVLIFSRKQVIQ